MTVKGLCKCLLSSAGLLFAVLNGAIFVSYVSSGGFGSKLINRLKGDVNVVNSREKRDENTPSVDGMAEHLVSPYTTGHGTTGGAVYTHWGRTTCPETDTQLVYKGRVGGSHYTHGGGASNYLCLPNEPKWGNYNDVADNLAPIYGAEYEIKGGISFPFATENLGKDVKVLQDHNVPCAVCMSTRRSTVLMIPGRNVCYSGWTLEYDGYLMAEHYTHPRTEFVCLDSAPEAEAAGFRDENGVLFYYVDAVCGSLPCPPYVQGRELTCAVCTK